MGRLEMSSDRARLRTATDQLRAAGIENPDQLVRLGAAAMIEKCLAAWRTKAVGPGQLAQMVKQGGPSDCDAGYVSQRQRILGEMNAWQRGYPEHADRIAS